jgi:hypothetical protein
MTHTRQVFPSYECHDLVTASGFSNLKIRPCQNCVREYQTFVVILWYRGTLYHFPPFLHLTLAIICFYPSFCLSFLKSCLLLCFEITPKSPVLSRRKNFKSRTFSSRPSSFCIPHFFVCLFKSRFFMRRKLGQVSSTSQETLRAFDYPNS